MYLLVKIGNDCAKGLTKINKKIKFKDSEKTTYTMFKIHNGKKCNK